MSMTTDDNDNKDTVDDDTSTTSTSTTSSFDPEIRRLMGSVATLGILETAFLTYSKLTGPSLDICGTAGDCASVLNGPYSMIPNTQIPIALLGLVAYLITAYLALEPVVFDKDDSDINRIALLSITTAMGTFSLFLLSLIYLILQTDCLYCLASAGFSITLMGCAWFGGCLPSTNSKLGVQAGVTSVVATTLAALVFFISVNPNTDDDDISSTLLASSSTTTTTSTLQQQQQQQEQQQLSPPLITTTSSPRALTLSRELSFLNTKLYGAYWCSHCYDQKQILGKTAFSSIDYIECDAQGANSQRSLCKERDVPGYPTWEINGKLYPGERELDELEDIVKEMKQETNK